MRRPLSATAFIVCLFVCVSVASAETMSLNLKFESKNQSMWGAGGAAPPVSRTYTIIDPNTVSWNLQTPDYPALKPGFVSVDTWFWGDIEFGFGGRAATNGHAGLFATLSVANAGSVDVTYPVVPVLTFPDANSFRAGDTITITSSYDRGSDWELSTVSPVVEFSLDSDLKFFVDVHGRICFIACTDTTSVLGIPSPTINFEMPEGPGTFNLFTVKTGDKFETPAFLGLFVPFSGSFAVPKINCARNPASPECQSQALNLRSIGATGRDEFLTGTIDLVGIAETVLKIPIPLNFDTDDYMSLTGYDAGVRFHYTIIGAEATAALTARQNFEFDPDLKIVYSFPEPLEHWVVSDGVEGTRTTGMSVELKAGDTLKVVTPPQKTPTAVSPAFRLDNQFKSTTGFEVSERIDLEAGDFGIILPELEIIPRLCTPGFCVDFGLLGEACVPEICTPRVTYDPPDFELAGAGALYEQSFPIATQDLGNIFSGGWQLPFDVKNVQALSIDPENPIVTIAQATGAVENLGEGKRRVVFALTIGNGGDVVLSDVELQNSLAATFADARNWTLDQVVSCTAILDTTYDGSSNVEVLGEGNTLPLEASRRILIYAIVSPKPDPAPFVSASHVEGTSPISTVVTADTSSTVELGQGVIDTADDFVLFGTHFVKLDSIARSWGHIGSNDFVEVKNGNSANVAGDLRAGKSIQVPGRISADYAISAGTINVVGKGELTLYGNMKTNQNVPSLSKTAPAFTPSTPLAGDVWLQPAEIATLAHGYYGAVTVNSGAKLQLQQGNYYIISLRIEQGGSVETVKGTQLVMRDLEVLPNGVITTTGPTRSAELFALQTDAIEIGSGAVIRGTVVAPRANIIFGAGSRIEGSAYGKSITMMPGASAKYHVDCDPVINANCDASADCF